MPHWTGGLSFDVFAMATATAYAVVVGLVVSGGCAWTCYTPSRHIADNLHLGLSCKFSRKDPASDSDLCARRCLRKSSLISQ